MAAAIARTQHVRFDLFLGQVMQRRTAADFPPEVLKLFDGYVHGHITRREFLDRGAPAFFEKHLKG
jgi:hypothetical protein